MNNFKLVRIDEKYCDYLRKFDSKVPFNSKEKMLRPFVGILFEINNYEYFAPLSSPKNKHLVMKDNVDFVRLDEGRLGAINFNNMIPVKESNIKDIDLNEDIKDDNLKAYNILLKKQIMWLNHNKNIVSDKARMLYRDYSNNIISESLKKRCCDFKLLESKCEEYNKQIVKN